MGSPLSTVRKHIAESETDRNVKMERLQILEKMVNSHLKEKKNLILNGVRGDQEIHLGTVVKEYMDVAIKTDSNPQTVDEAVDAFFSGNFLDGAKKLVKLTVSAIAENISIGEHEQSSFLILWEDNALIRSDLYIYRWNFSASGVITDCESVSGILLMKRVVDILRVDIQVLTWAISCTKEGDADGQQKEIAIAMEMISKVAKLKTAIAGAETKAHGPPEENPE